MPCGRVVGGHRPGQRLLGALDRRVGVGREQARDRIAREHARDEHDRAPPLPCSQHRAHDLPRREERRGAVDGRTSPSSPRAASRGAGPSPARRPEPPATREQPIDPAEGRRGRRRPRPRRPPRRGDPRTRTRSARPDRPLVDVGDERLALRGVPRDDPDGRPLRDEPARPGGGDAAGTRSRPRRGPRVGHPWAMSTTGQQPASGSICEAALTVRWLGANGLSARDGGQAGR